MPWQNGELQVTVLQCYPLYNHPIWNEAEYDRSFNRVVDYVGVCCRSGMQKHYVDFIPLDYPQYAKQLEDGRTNTWEPDIFFGVVSPPDEKGYCSFGNALWYNKDVARTAKCFVAEVDPTFIRTHGDNWIHVSEIDYLVEETKAFLLGRIRCRTKSTDSEVIGEFASTLIRDGDTVQMGIGAISEAIGLFLMDRNDLGIHSEIMTASHGTGKARCGDGKYKTLNKGKASGDGGCCGLGTVDNNQLLNCTGVVYQFTVDHCCAELTGCVNSTLAIDLTGGPQPKRLVHRCGSHWRADDLHDGGDVLERRSLIMVLPSTAKKGQLSRIVPMLEQGSTITTPRQYLTCGDRVRHRQSTRQVSTATG
jgi:4-hydroxybutyrate CoA-transferase